VVRDLTDDYAVLQTGYWRVEIDTAHPRFISIHADANGLGSYCQEMFEPGYGGESISETAENLFRSRHSVGHEISVDGWRSLNFRNIRLGDFAIINWKIMLTGKFGEILRIEVTRKVLQEIELVTDVPFGFQCLREFAFWSHPSLRFGHDPTDGYRTKYSSREEIAARRVIGYHNILELPEFFIHSSPSYPDLSIKLNSGYYHIEQHYGRYVLFGISSRDFSSGPITLPIGEESWILELKSIPQGIVAPVTFRSKSKLANHFVPVFFDSYLLSAIACDHEMFGNNPYRHAYAPGAIDFILKGYLVTDRRSWSETQGDIEERWRHHIRRTLTEGRFSKERLITLLDSGVWQDACGRINHKYEVYSPNALFVTACCYHLLKTGDMEFAREIYKDLQALLNALCKLDSDSDGLLENPIPGTPGCPASGYNDMLGIGHKDGYLNAVVYEAYFLFASLCEAIGKNDTAVLYRELAKRLADAYNDQLWNEETRHYVGWIDIEGKSHDCWYTYTNFPAISAGIPSIERTRRIMESFVAHPNHHRIFAAGLNLDPIQDGSINYLSEKEFGLWLNGGVLLGSAAYELFARAVGLGGEGAWVMLYDLMKQWEKDNLAGTPLFDWCRPFPHIFSPRLRYTGKNAYTWIDGKGATGAGTEPYLSDGGAILWALYTGILGIRPDFQGITFIPHLPKALADTKVTIRLMGRELIIYIKGYGDSLKSLTLNKRKVRGNRLTWESMQDNSIINIEATE